MSFANTRQLSTLWVCAFVGALFLHIALGAQFYFRNIGVSKGILSSTVMLTFAQEALYLDVGIDSSSPDRDTDLSNVSTEPELLPPDLAKQEAEILETVDEVQPEGLQRIYDVEKDDFTVKSLEESLLQKVEDKIFEKKPIPVPKAVVKQLSVKAVHSSVAKQGGSTAALEDMLLMEWLAKVQSQLERQKNYVVRQRTSWAKGTVKLEFRVHKQGNIFSSRVVASAGDPELDRLAMAALQRIGSFPPPPPSKVNKAIRVSLIFS
ncbi:energy transducer TonB family protein [Bartonella rattimassiliensis]|uniref:TonB family domain-containing protein n=1 Tax=Bartonella rattimassiliensis 15908 TaxID=1094556 RepID=J1JPE8_9HYPH|nr:TonB family protein [Bartonella rattimassiliensis]EJF86647.1 TonB family domain-containing protein [Bartonella rattimassiliensis 15908]